MCILSSTNCTTEIKLDADSVATLESPPYIDGVDSDEVAMAANAATSWMCDNAKDEGIEIYTIAFQVTDGATKSLLRKCASSNDKAMTADSNAALVDRFEKLASSLGADIRLMR